MPLKAGKSSGKAHLQETAQNPFLSFRLFLSIQLGDPCVSHLNEPADGAAIHQVFISLERENLG